MLTNDYYEDDITAYSMPSFEDLLDELDSRIGRKSKRAAYAFKELSMPVQLSTGFICKKIARIDDEVAFVDSTGAIERAEYCTVSDLHSILTVLNKYD